MAFDFPSSPSLGQVYNNYVWDGEKWTQAAVINASNQSGVIAITVFVSSGTWVPKPNMTSAVIEGVGGGGGGGGAIGVVATSYSGGGGGSGAYFRTAATAVQIGASQAVTIGAGGAGGISNTTPAGSGGATSVGTLGSAGGGAGGGGGNISSAPIGGQNGAAGTGDVAVAGMPGGAGGYNSGSSSAIYAGGGGGSSHFGGGAIPSGPGSGAVNNGNGANGYGGGGSGAGVNGIASSSTGGVGRAGLVVITEYGLTSLAVSANTGAVRYDLPQGLSANQMAQGRANAGVLKKNYIINGAMMVSQENPAPAAGSTNGFYAVDQFSLAITGTSGAVAIAQAGLATPGGSPNRLRVSVTTADAAVAAGDAVWIGQTLEGLRIADLGQGTVGAKAITIQFGCKGPAGTYCVSMRNGTPNRSYIAEYVIAAGEANTDTVKSVTFTLDTTGTWAKDNTAGAYISWALMTGTTYQQAANSWGASASAIGSPNQFNLLGTNGNIFELFDVSLTEGSVAPPFMVPDYATEKTACRRYYLFDTFAGNALWLHPITPDIGYRRGRYLFKPEMRANPTVTISAVPNSGTFLGGMPAVSNPSTVSVELQGDISTVSGWVYCAWIKANARL